MADVSAKLAKTLKMVEEGEYFIINRPRQYGKTTTLYTLAETLEKTGQYLVFNISFEGIGDAIFQDEKLFTEGFVDLLARSIKRRHSEKAAKLNELAKGVTNMNNLSDSISEFLETIDKKAVVLIDEVDKSSNNQLFVSFLAMLRHKYLDRRSNPAFHSVVLAGVHDVKTLKLKLRPDEEQKYNSPWNIAAEFKVDMNLQPSEIKPMLDDYVSEKGVKMDTQKIADLLFYYTSGYPFLVSKLCKMMDEDVLPTQKVPEWTKRDLEKTVRELVLETNTNFETVIKNLENNSILYQIVYKMLVEAEFQDYNVHDPNISLGIMLGILKNGRGIKIHNKIYEELIYHYMTSRTKTNLYLAEYTISKNFKLPDNELNMELVLRKFQSFMHEHYSERVPRHQALHDKHDRDFLERNGRLVFLAFLKPILNGHGYDFKEAQISEERRLDVTITFYQHKYVAELKIWRGKAAHEEGLLQLEDYLERLKLTGGYLIIFDHAEVKSWDAGWIDHFGKRIFVVWV